MLDSKGRISIFRVSVIGAVIGAVLIIGGILSFNNDINSRRTPLNIETFVNAELWGAPREQGTTRTVFFRARGATVEQVVAHYQQQLTAFETGQRCVRTPGTGEIPVDPTLPNSVPYRYDCMFDRSGVNSTQYTRVTIYPGIANDDPFFDTSDSTVIAYEQVWQP
jgi:hypothetical protein